MAIQPIDLQTLFTQMDKVAKTQSAQREGVALQQSIQGTELQKKTEAHIQSVNEAQNTGEGAEKVKDRGAKSQGGGHSGGKKKEDAPGEHESNNGENQDTVFHDPSLGKNIDISI